MGADERFLDLLSDLSELHAAKAADYGDGEDAYSNFRRAQRLGISPFMGCLVRLSDKWERIVRLSQHEARVKDEAITDTLRDMAVYAMIALILYQEEPHGGDDPTRGHRKF